jgi:hypothetical protein
MSSTETGHAKNVSNFETLISFCSGYGAKYQPSQDVLKVANLQTQYISADASLDICKKTETAFDNAVDGRRDAFEDIQPLATRILNALAASGVADNVLEGAKTINRKIHGKRATPIEEPKKSEDGTDLPTTSISASQQGFDNLIANFNGLLELVSSQEEYNPNEAELTVAGLQAYMAVLKASNTVVKTAYTIWSNDRIERDEVMYGDKTGMVDVAFSVKKYVKALFGASSPQLKQISGLGFKRPKD